MCKTRVGDELGGTEKWDGSRDSRDVPVQRLWNRKVF